MSRRRRCTDAGGAREDGRENVVEERLRVDALALAHGRVDHAVDGHDAQGAPAAAAAREPGREVGALALPRAAVPPPQGPRVLPRLVDHDELVRRNALALRAAFPRRLLLALLHFRLGHLARGAAPCPAMGGVVGSVARRRRLKSRFFSCAGRGTVATLA